MTPRIRCLALAALLLAGCSSPELRDYDMTAPEMDLPGYFVGTTHAWGQFQDRFGKVRRRFRVDINGRWENDVLTLVEDFVYDDGATETRTWELKPQGDNRWEGYADGVVGVAQGEVAGNAFNWRYTFDLSTGENETLRVHFDDWLWRQDDDVVINRAYISKFGLAVGEVLIFFTKARSAGSVAVAEAAAPWPRAAGE